MVITRRPNSAHTCMIRWSKAVDTGRSLGEMSDKEVEVDEANEREAVHELWTAAASCTTCDRGHNSHQLCGGMMGLVWLAGLYCPIFRQAMAI